MSEDLDSLPPKESPPITELPTAENAQLHGRRIVAGRYEILSKLGKGGMGEVWHAFDVKLRVDVALKSLRLDVKRNENTVEALRREVRTAREVISPNVCRIFDLVVEEESELISMEYIDGITLIVMLTKKGSLELQQARDIAAQFLAGLEAIHQAGLVHRDLKPENIMITRTGRVVVMDFGVAKQIAQVGGTVSGTLPYMSPEQLAGEKVDARSDVFSAGVVLAEMIHPEGVLSQKTREGIWNVVRKDPLQLPESPWKAVIARAVSPDPAARFPSAGALARALEEVTLRVETIEERRPYPGLASFTAADAEYFFGRELEVETVIKKLQQLHLVALIGPSGAGKTSFLRAGLTPALPDGWSHIFCTPGDSPLVNLGQSLVPDLSADVEAMRKMVRLEDTTTALWLLQRWSQNHPQTLLIIDRFEELFTLNGPQTQSDFSELLGRAALDTNVRVLLAMRDDFLFNCHHHPALAPIFSELTPLGALAGPALRRALVQPALKCGYRFEDDTLVDEILPDVEKERGALPLMAFAAARLWEKRDRTSGLLTRDAYKEIGGVAGALAQHAESTMERIGAERQPIVREIFRNLITAQNTRAARDTEQLLSVFPEKTTAEEVLGALIDARLLTSFEAPQAEGEKPKSRVEIIHESLLSNWPRLVRWQTQDADSAQLRDQLRQAAQLWEERGRSQDLLWTGASYLEFQAWRQRYPGGLSSTEEAFAQAMKARATRRRRQRRLAVAAMFVILLAILAVVSDFWRGEKSARKQAVSEAQRAEANKLLAMGRLQLDINPSISLAYALASIETADTAEGRRFAMEALWKGPTAQVLDMPTSADYVEFSPNGKWLAVGGWGGVRLVPADRSQVKVLDEHWDPRIGSPRRPHFSPNGEYVVWTSGENPSVVKVWSLSRDREVRTLKMEGETRCLVRGGRLFLLTGRTEENPETSVDKDTLYGKWRQSAIWSWAFDDRQPQLVSRWNLEPVSTFDIDPGGTWMAYAKGNGIYVRPVNGSGQDRLIGEHTTQVREVKFHSKEHHLASSDSRGEIRIWSLEPNSKTPARVIAGNGPLWNLFFDASGSTLAAISNSDSSLRIWDLNAPGEAAPLLLHGFTSSGAWNAGAFDPASRCIASHYGATENVAIWCLGHQYPYVFQKETFRIPVFTPDGKSLITGSLIEGVRLLNLHGQEYGASRELWKPKSPINDVDIDPSGKQVLIATWREGVLLGSIPDGAIRQLPGGSYYYSVSFSRDGRLAAASTVLGWEGSYDKNPDYASVAGKAEIVVWNLETGKVEVLRSDTLKYPVPIRFSSDGSLFSGDADGSLVQWNLHNHTSRLLGKSKGPVNSIAITKDSRFVVVSASTKPRKGPYEESSETTELIVYDLQTRTSRTIASHGNRVFFVALASDDKILVTGDSEGIVRSGPITGEAPHLLMGHTGLASVTVDPSGKWIASAGVDFSVRLWSIPKGQPLHTLPYNQFVSRLSALTNVRVVADKTSSTGYSIKYAPFPGWEKIPSW